MGQSEAEGTCARASGIFRGRGVITVTEFSSHRIEAVIDAKEKSIVQINTVYYPGWGIELDGQPVPVDYRNGMGLMRVAVPEGTHQISVEFRETVVRFIADGISIVSGIVAIGMLIVLKMKRHIFSLIVLLLLSFGAIRPLLAKGFFPMHDDTQVGRVIVMGKALRNGQFPVRWVSDLGYGYGYPLFNYYGPLPYYVGGFLYALGLPAVEATKVIFLIRLYSFWNYHVSIVEYMVWCFRWASFCYFISLCAISCSTSICTRCGWRTMGICIFAFGSVGIFTYA